MTEITRKEKKLLKKLDIVSDYVARLMNKDYEKSSNEKQFIDTLLLLFQKIRKKYAIQDKKRQIEQYKSSKGEKYFVKKIIWIHPFNGKKTISTIDSIQCFADEEFNKLIHSKVHKRFITSYLHAHGIIFTEIGMENFQEVAWQMLFEFRKLLFIKPFPTHMNRFLQYLDLNKFAIQNKRPMKKSDEEGEGSSASKVYSYAVAVSWEMISLIIDKCNQILVENMAMNDGSSFDYMNVARIECLFQPIQEWCLWLVKEPDVLKLSCSDYNVLPGTESYWIRLATFANTLNKIKLHYNLPVHHLFVKKMKLPDFMGSVNYILGFVSELLCHHDPPIFKLQTNDHGRKEYISLVGTIGFENHSNDEVAYSTIIKITPFYIVLDTDCFIDFFGQMFKLIKYFSDDSVGSFICIMVIPSIVITELQKKTTSPGANLTLQYLSVIDSKSVIRYATPEGLFFNSINFMGNIKTMSYNVDSLLSTCKYIAKLKNPEAAYAAGGEPRKIVSDVVLLTGNKSIRSKAISEDIPVKTMLEFVSWLNV